mgnify:CR=1 FL=1
MKEIKKETKKEVKKEKKSLGVLKITKPNGNVITREALEGIAKHYEAKGWKVEEV